MWKCYKNRFNKLINRRIAQWFEFGLFNEQLKREIRNTKKTPLVEEMPDFVIDRFREHAKMKLEMFGLIFVIYAFGMFAAFFIFIGEHMKKMKYNNILI